MGVEGASRLQYNSNMKAFIAIIATLLAAVRAEAEAEADPAVLYANAYHPYGHYGYGYGLGAYAGYAGYYGGYGLGHYAGYYGLPAAYGTYGNGIKSAPCVNAWNAPVPCARKKRDADADAEADADPALLYAGFPYAGYGLGGVYGYGAHAYGIPYAYGAGVVAGAAPPHGVAYTAAGAVHSSHVGVCTNYLGAQVPC